MAGGSGQQTTTTKTDPWSAQQPYLKDIMSQGQSVYNSGAGGEYFPGSTVVPFSPDTMSGINQIRNTASQPAFGASQAQGLIGNLMNGGQPNRTDVLNTAASGGFTNPVVSQLSGQAPGTQQIMQGSQGATPYVGDLVSAGQQRVTAGNPVLDATARGDYLNANPALNSVIDKTADTIRNNVGAVFSRGGRYGSAAHQQTLSDSVGDATSNILNANYQAERGRQMGAASELGAREAGDINRNIGTLGQAAGYGSADLSRLMQGGQALAGIDMSRAGLLGQFANQDTATRLGAASDINQYGLAQGQQGLGALASLPGLRDYSQSGARDLMSIGQAQEGQARSELQDQIDRWNFSQQAPWDQLGRYSGIVGGLGNLGGTATSTGPKQAGGGLMGALGGTAGAAGIGSLLGWGGAPATATAAATAMNPMMWPLLIGGGLLGAFS